MGGCVWIDEGGRGVCDARDRMGLLLIRFRGGGSSLGCTGIKRGAVHGVSMIRREIRVDQFALRSLGCGSTTRCMDLKARIFLLHY